MQNKDYNENLIFHDSDGNEKAILGTLEGECADCIDATRNGRHYSDSLWRKVFSNPIVNELIDNGGIPGEFDHPLDRDETDSARIAILMREKPKEKNGKLWAKFDILNTPLGKIAYTLAKAGFKLGVSSRGSGDTFINNKGEEEVDESTYDFKCFDLVLLPAVKSARLKLVTEGLQNRFDYKKALKESLNSASDKDRKIMESTLNNLGIDYQEKPDILSIVSNQFGTTVEPFYGKTYIMPNGNYLNLQRCKNHADVEKYLIDNNFSDNIYNPKTGSKSLSDLGCIRCSSDDYYVALNDREPTPEQYSSLGKWLNNLGETTKIVEIITPERESIVCDLQESLGSDSISKIYNYYHKINEDIKINTPVNPSSSGNNNTVTDDSIDLDNIDDKEDEENNSSTKEDKDIVNQNNMEAKNSGSDVVEDLQEALRKNRELEKQILELQEKLSVCYAKEAKSDEAIQKYRSSIKSLSESLKKATSINQKASILENQLDEKNKEIEQKQKLIEDLESKNKNSIIRKRQEVSSLNESLIDKDREIETLTKRVKALNENLSSIKGESEKEINNLKEQLGEAKKDALITAKNYSNKIAKSNEIVEQYKKTAQKAVNKYIDLQASFLGITANEIKNRLPKSYSFNDIDSICENLQEYRVNISKLPFAVDSLNEDFGSSKIRMQAEESKDSLLEHSQDDSVDNELLGMVDRFIKK